MTKIKFDLKSSSSDVIPICFFLLVWLNQINSRDAKENWTKQAGEDDSLHSCSSCVLQVAQMPPFNLKGFIFFLFLKGTGIQSSEAQYHLIFKTLLLKQIKVVPRGHTSSASVALLYILDIQTKYAKIVFSPVCVCHVLRHSVATILASMGTPEMKKILSCSTCFFNCLPPIMLLWKYLKVKQNTKVVFAHVEHPLHQDNSEHIDPAPEQAMQRYSRQHN